MPANVGKAHDNLESVQAVPIFVLGRIICSFGFFFPPVLDCGSLLSVRFVPFPVHLGCVQKSLRIVCFDIHRLFYSSFR